MSEEQNNKEIQDEHLPEVEQELSQVASNPKQNMAILFVIASVFAYLFFNLFVDSNQPVEEETPVPEVISKPAQAENVNDTPLIPTLPEPPSLDDPTPPPPPSFSTNTTSLPVVENKKEEILPPLPVEAPVPEPVVEQVTLPNDSLPIITPSGNEEAIKRLKEKRKSNIILLAGTVPAKTPEQIEQEANFKYRGDMSLILARGKMLDAIIENAVNSDFGGEIRAIISRDVYSEWGKNILIPKGSKIFGSYSSGINGSYGRIGVEWTRVDFANGYTLTLSSTSKDSLGRDGIQGRVDNKFKERLSNAILRSFFNISLAKGLDKLVQPQINSQAAAALNSTASNLQNIANTIATDASKSASQKRVEICASGQNSIEDKTSSTFLSLKSTCDSLATDSSQTEEQKLTSLLTQISSLSTSLVQNTTSNVEETKAQEASKQAFTDISDVVKTLVEEQEFKPTITINQGTPIKIYVNKDYKFPKAAVSRKRL